MTPMRRMFPLLLMTTMVILAGCEISVSDPLPDGYIASSTRVLSIRVDQPLTDDHGKALPVRTMGGFDGGPAAPITESVNVLYKNAGVKAVQFPRGWGCDYTLDGVFPNVLADPGSDGSYRFTDIEDMAKGFVSHGMLPIWQALYDVGSGTCRADDKGGAGNPIGDPVLWGEVVTHTLGYLNRKVAPYFNDEYKARLAELGMSPGYVEVLPDPMTCCGYQALGFDYLQPVYSALFESLARLDEESAGSRILAVAAPSYRISTTNEISDQTSPMGRFLAFAAQRPAGQVPDLWSLMSSTRSPDAQTALLGSLQAGLAAQGLPSTRVADLGMRVAPAVWEARAADLDTTAKRSAYAGAFLTMAKILGQDTIELIVPDRRGGPAGKVDAMQGEDLFLDADGTPLPAFHTLMPFNVMDLSKSVRVRVEDDNASAGPRDIRVLAGVNKDGGVGIIVAMLPTLDDPRVGYRVTYRLQISGLPDGPRTLRRAIIDAGTTGFRYTESSLATPTRGLLTIARQATSPSVQYLELNVLPE